jgi:hypothetical protein
MTEMSITVGVMTKKGVQHVIAVWRVEKVNWCLLDLKDEQIAPDTVPCSLHDFSFSNKNGLFRYVRILPSLRLKLIELILDILGQTQIPVYP